MSSDAYVLETKYARKVMIRSALILKTRIYSGLKALVEGRTGKGEGGFMNRKKKITNHKVDVKISFSQMTKISK